MGMGLKTNRSTLSALALCVYAVGTLALSHPAQAQTPSTSSTSALRNMTQGNWLGARSDVQKNRDPVLVTMYEWMLYRENFTGLPFDRIANFLTHHPQWPDRREIIASAERNMPDAYPTASVIAWYRQTPPVTGVGLGRYLEALREAGQAGAQASVLRAAWPGISMRPEVQAGLYRSYGSLLDLDTNRRRIDRLLIDGDDGTAKSLAALVGRGYPQLVEARLALSKGSKNAAYLVSKLPASLANDPGLMFERLKFRRKSDQDEGAIEILNRQPPMASISNPEDWWKERNIIVRRFIEERNFKEAYRLASRHDQMDGQEYADAEWLSGWLSLRFLHQPERAYTHFTAMYGRVKTAISKSRAAYWAGRTAEALGKADEARTWYQNAAQYPKVYYGQLAAMKLPGGQRGYRPVTVTATQADKARVAANELVRGVKLAHAAGQDRMRRQLINATVETLSSPADFKAFAEMLSGLGLRHEAVRVAKKAAGKNIFLDIEAYPTLKGPYEQAGADKALAHAIMRQESEFDQNARSPSGALGLMQLMPATAKEVAQRKGWSHQNGWLTTRPEHNILLGSSYITTLVRSYNGSYPLAMAAYNAGGGRVNQWLRENGDPRLGKVDWVDWIELIPIYETRNYVQRVTESYVVYNEYMGMKNR